VKQQQEQQLLLVRLSDQPRPALGLHVACLPPTVAVQVVGYLWLHTSRPLLPSESEASW